MINRLIASAAAALLLTACGGEPASSDAPPPSPALWKIASQDGAVEGWLFGTIHALPDGVEWQTSTLTDVVADADVLALEIAEVADRSAIAQSFAELATTPEQPSLFWKVKPEYHPALRELLAEGGLDAADYRDFETWAAALSIAQIGSQSDTENGVDAALVPMFAQRTIIELEGTQRQLGIFDQLPESEQRDLLTLTIKATQQRMDDPQRLMRAWLAGDMGLLTAESTMGILSDPELRAALLINRNRDWATQLERILPQEPQVLVAVGAAHMVGPDGLPAMLEAAGYTITRIQ